MNGTVQVRVKNVYGEDKVYPANMTGCILAEIAGTKTLTARTMQLIRQLGCTVEVLTGELPAGF